MKDLGALKSFVGIENTTKKRVITISQQKYALDILTETNMHAFYIKNALGSGILYEDKGNAKIICYSNVDWVGSPLDRRSSFRYYRSKKQNIVAKSSAEVEYHTMIVVA
ncbi:hypothetical protein CR513_37236, partial [Mucuna pruriens]